jgi:hypothetical protein
MRKIFFFFVAIWVGTMNDDELIDKQYSKKLFTFTHANL